MKRMFAAVVVVVFGIAGCATGQGVATDSAVTPGQASPPSSSPPSSSPTTSSPTTGAPGSAAADAPLAMPVGDLEAGVTYAIDNEAPGRLIFTVPGDGWFSIDTWFLGKDELAADGYDMALLPYFVGNLYADACHWQGNPLDPPVGSTVDDLATALVAQDGPSGPPPTDVEIGGYAGRKVELSIPEKVDPATCDEGDYGRWSLVADPSWYGPFTYGREQHDTVYIVDVDGTRWVIAANHLPGTSAADLAELERLVASIRFEP